MVSIAPDYALKDGDIASAKGVWRPPRHASEKDLFALVDYFTARKY
jgi:hypothetical protein